MSTITTVDSTVLFTQEDVNNALKSINRNFAPFWMYLQASGQMDKVSSTDIAWFLDESRPTHARLAAGIDNVVTTITVDDENFGVTEQIIRIGDELMKVTNVTGTPTTTLTVTRGFGGTTATAHAINAQIKFNGFDLPEDSPYIDSKSTVQSKYTNITQPFMETYGLTETAQAVAAQGMGGRKAMAVKFMQALETTIGQLENAMISGIKFETGKTRRMDGLESIIEAEGIVKAIGGALSFEAIDEAARTLANAGAKAKLKAGMYYLVAPLEQIPKINSLNQNIVDNAGNAIQRVTRAQDEILGTEVLQIRTSAGTIKVLEITSMSETKVGIVDMTEMRAKALIPLKNQPQPKEGLVDSQAINGEYSLEVGSPKLQLIMTGLTL